MGWFRLHKRRWSWVALLALALQFGLAFGHVHATHADHPTASVTGNVSPSDTGDSDDANYCATCAILALFNATLTAAPPAIDLPTPPASAEIAIEPEAARIIASRAAFRSRAPPLS
jgi:hypothetical protein